MMNEYFYRISITEGKCTKNIVGTMSALYSGVRAWNNFKDSIVKPTAKQYGVREEQVIIKAFNKI